MKKNLRCILLLFTLALSAASLAQTTLRGQVLEEGSGLFVPYTDVRVKGTTKGTFANDSGYFSIPVDGFPVTLIFSSVGYKSREVNLPRPQAALTVKLVEQTNAIDAVVVKAGENPAHPIVRSVIKNKKRNNPSNINAHRAQVYRKTLGQLHNIDSATVAGNAVLRSLKKSMLGQRDGTARYTIPLMFSEEVKEEVFSRSPYLSYDIPQVSRREGLSVFEQASLFSDYIEIFSREVNFYDDNFMINGTPMLSPISPLAFAYYHFRLQPDTVYNSETGLRELRIRFLPKNPRNAVFEGEMVVCDSLFAVKSISAKLSPYSNVPFVIRYEARVNYMMLRDSSGVTSFVESNHLNIDYHFWKYKDDKDHAAANIRLYSHYSDVQLNPPLQKMLDDEKMLNEAKKISDNEMQPLRKDSLSTVEQEATVAMSALRSIGWVSFADKASIVLGSGYYNVGKIDIGPYGEVLRLNGAEGVRLNLPMRTNNVLHPNFFADGMVGFGTKDKKLKGVLDMGWKFNTRLRQTITVGGEYNSFRVGGNEEHFKLIRENVMALSEDLLWFSMLSVKLDNKYTTRYGGSVSYEREWRRWLLSHLTLSSYNLESSRYTPFTHRGAPVKVFNQQELSLRLRISSNAEQRTDFFARRIYLSNGNLPIVQPVLTVGAYSLRGVNSSGYYAKLHVAVKQSVAIGTTWLNHVVEAGAIFGAVPFPLLEGHRSIESFMYASHKFNLLYNLSLVSDRYASALVEYNLNGLLLNQMPLLKRFNIKELLTCKLLYNFLDLEKHGKILDIDPSYIYARNSRTPYVEAGLGVTNIFQVLGVGCVWRIPLGDKQSLPYSYTNFSVVMRAALGG